MKCPGQDSRLWGPEAIFESECPNCGGPLEFFKDESSRRCRQCGHKALNPRMDFGCAAYCRFAEQCLGQDLPPELLARRVDLLKDRVAAEVKKALGRDFRRIGRALRVVEYAEKLQKSEAADPAVVTLAAILSAITEDAAAENGAGAEEIPAKIRGAAELLARVGAPEELGAQTLAILRRLHISEETGVSADFRCVSDAIRIVSVMEAFKAKDCTAKEAEEMIFESIMAPAARELALQALGEAAVQP